MRKRNFHFRKGWRIRLYDQSGKTVVLSLERIDMNDEYAEWDVKIRDSKTPRLIEGEDCAKHELTKLWPGSWIALRSPVRFFEDGKGGFSPEFVVRVPADVRVTALSGG